MERFDSIYKIANNPTQVRVGFKFGLIDNYGHKLTPIKYDAIGIFTCGVAEFKIDHKCGLIHESGEEIFEAKFDNIIRFYEPKLAFVRIGDNWGVVNTNGIELCQIIHDYDYLVKNQNYYIQLNIRLQKLKSIL